MTHRRARVARQVAAERPYEIWNAFIAFVSEDPRSMGSLEQHAASLVSRYEAEVQNGGHLQYLSNKGILEAEETVDGLRQLGAAQHAELLEGLLRSLPVVPSRDEVSSAEYVSHSLEDPYGGYDRAFHELEPPLVLVLERYLEANLDAFIEFDERGA
jgi:hypothetical protein